MNKKIYMQLNSEGLAELREEGPSRKRKLYPAVKMASLEEDLKSGKAVTINISRGLFTFVDKSDEEAVKEFKWIAHSSVKSIYVKMANSGLPLHRFLMNPEKYKMVDHINGEPLDNRRCNLRICSHAENSRNRDSVGKWLYKGVSKNKRCWNSTIRVNGKLKSFGNFTSPEKAARSYDYHATRIFGEFARTNFPDVATEEPKSDHVIDRKGSKSSKPILNESQVAEIKKMIKSGISSSKIALNYPVSSRTIRNIAQGKAWSHV